MSFANPLLNEDILPEVFKFLTVRDRKNARLVCKLWLDVCSYEKFAKTEAFFICNVYDYQTIVDVLRNSKRKSLNLKFDQSFIDEASLPLWKACGKRIDSLNFYECTFLLRLIPQIFKLCVNLTEFTLKEGEFVGKKKFHRHPFAVVSILLPKKEIMRTKLTSLNLESYTVELKSQDVRRLACTFPSLRTLKMNIALDDYVRPADCSSQSPNFATLLNLFETSLKGIETIDIHFPIRHQIGIIDTHMTFIRQHEGSRLEPVPLLLEPFFKVYKNLTETPFVKYCKGMRVDGTFRAPYVTPDLTVMARIVEGNPLMEYLDMHYLVLENVADFCTFFAALVKSRLKRVTLGVTSWPDSFASELDTLLEIEDLPVNHSVRRLKIYSTTESLSLLCLKYFGNVEHLSMKPGVAGLIFKSQPNLKHLSITCDEDTCSTSEENTIENLEVLNVRGAGFNFLSGYRFPNLKYVYFFYEDDDDDDLPDSDYSDDTTNLSETNTVSDSTENVNLDKPEYDDSDADEDLECDDYSITSSEGPFPIIFLATLADFSDSEDSDSSDRSSEWSPNKDEKDTLLGFLTLDLDERGGSDRESSSLQDATEQESDTDVKLIVSKIEKIVSFICENAPNLEGFRFSCYQNSAFSSTEVCTAFFKACSNFRKLRYLAVNKMNNNVSAVKVKAEMLKYMSLCPSLRVVWFDCVNWDIALYYNTVTNKLESTDNYFSSTGMLDLRNFHQCAR